MDNKEIQDEEKPCVQSTQGITQKDFETFLIERNIDIANTDKGQLFETFLLFQKFMNCMLSTTGIAQPQNEPEHIEEDKKSIKEKEQEYSKKDDDEVNLDNIDNVIETNINKDDIHSEENTKEHNEEIKHEHEDLMENYNKAQSENEIPIAINNDNKEQEATHNNNIVNYDEIPIKPVDVNFVELVEKNLAELKYTPDNRDSSCEPKFKYRKKSSKKQKITKRNKSNERPQNKTVSHISKSKKTNISTTRSAVIKSKLLQSKSMNNKPNENFENDTINEDDSIIINKPITQTQSIYLGLNKEEEKNNSLNIVEPIDDVNEATISNSDVIYNFSMTEDEDIKDEANEHCNAINIKPTPYTNKMQTKPKMNKNIMLKNQFEKKLKILKEEKKEVAKQKAK